MESNIMLVPFGELGPGQPAAIRNKVKDGLIAQASREQRLPPEGLVVRDLLPKTDLDYSYEDWRETTGTTPNTWETMSSSTSSDQRYIAIFGIKDDVENQSCSALKFTIGGGDKAIWQLTTLNPYDGMVGMSSGAIVIPPNTPYTIYRWVRSISSTSNIILKGLVVEPRGKLVSP